MLPVFIIINPSNFISLLSRLSVAIAFILPMGCSAIKSGEAQTESRPVKQQQQTITVDVAIARKGILETTVEYIGTTLPNREVSLRSQVEGQILDVTVDVGDIVRQGQIVAQIDDNLLTSEVAEAEAEVAALEAEVVSLEAEVSDAQAEVELLRLELQQAKSDATRSEQLYDEGAISKQNVELARTEVGTTNQALKSARQQVQNQLAAVNAAQRRVTAQQALADRAKRRQSYTTLTAPVNGSVLERILEPGDLARSGDEILRLGDLNQVKVEVQISELELNKIKQGNPTEVRLDAFRDRIFTGKISQISPVADPTSRLIPIEVTLPNEDKKIGSGLLARVNFELQTKKQIVIPETAIQNDQLKREQQTATIFVVNGKGEQAKAEARTVTIGRKVDNRVEILSGLESGEQFIIRSSQELQDGDQVRLSFISET